jgi:5-methylcytosine-specific restriction endonuclease McrA
MVRLNNLTGIQRRRKMIQVAIRDGWFCFYCKRPLTVVGLRSPARWTDPAKPTLDHVIAWSKGGTHALQNLRLACGLCNSRKGDREEVS